MVKWGHGHERGSGEAKDEVETPISSRKRARKGPLEDDQVKQDQLTIGLNESSPYQEPRAVAIWMHGFLSHCHRIQYYLVARTGSRQRCFVVGGNWAFIIWLSGVYLICILLFGNFSRRQACWQDPGLDLLHRRFDRRCCRRRTVQSRLAS